MDALRMMLHQPVVHALEHALVSFLWQGTVVALVVAGLLALLPRQAASARYATACLGLLVMAVMPVGMFLATLAYASPAAFQESLAGTWALSESPTVVAALTPSAAMPEAAPRWMDVLRPWLLSAWACGVLLLSLRTAIAWAHASRLSHAGTRAPSEAWARALEQALTRVRVSRPVRLLESFAVEVPMVVGLWRPLILVPASAMVGLSAAQLEAILAHELAHIRRHDSLVNLLQTLVETVLFYHPAVWWLSQRIRDEREHCADDLAVQGGGDVLLYARALAYIEELRAVQPRASLGAGGGSLLSRIRRLLAAPEQGTPRRPWRLAGALGVSALVVLLCASRVNATPGELASVARETLKELAQSSVPPMLDPRASFLPPLQGPAPLQVAGVEPRSRGQAPSTKMAAAPVPVRARTPPAMPLLIPETGAVAGAELSRKPFTLEPEPEPVPALEALPLGLPDLSTLRAQVANRRGGEARAEPPEEEVLWLRDGFTRPRLLSGEELVYPEFSRGSPLPSAESLQGSVVARCTLTTEGVLVQCKLLERMAALDADVLRVLSTRRYTPAMYQGQPVSVPYVVKIQFAMPQDSLAAQPRLLHKNPEGPRCSNCLNVSYGPGATVITFGKP